MGTTFFFTVPKTGYLTFETGAGQGKALFNKQHLNREKKARSRTGKDFTAKLERSLMEAGEGIHAACRT